MPSVNQSFCLLPFVQTVVRTHGMMSPCCNAEGWIDIRDVSVKDFWADAKLAQMRNLMLDGQPVPACYKCYNDEKSAGRSMRLDSFVDYRVSDKDSPLDVLQQLDLIEIEAPRRIEMHVGNLCNLKCLTCRPEDSSSFLTENRVLKISEHRQENYQIPEDVMLGNLKSLLDHGLDYLDLRGGESMMVPAVKRFLLDLPQGHGIKRMRLQTNGTIPIDDDWVEILQKFPWVEMMISVDAYAEDNHYIRYPADWTQIENNFDILKPMLNVHVLVACVVSNLNLPVLPKLIDWCRQKKIDFHWMPLTHPAHYQYHNLPELVLEKAIQSLQQYQEFGGLQLKPQDPAMWIEFCRMINIRDQHRRNSIFDMLPELKEYWVTNT